MNSLEVRTYVEYLRMRNYSRFTLLNYACSVRKFVAFLKGRPMARASRERIQAFLDSLRGYSARTRTHIQMALAGYYRMLRAKGLLLANPMEGMRYPRLRQPSKRPTLSVEEMERLLAAPDTRTRMGIRNRAMLELLYTGAIRRTELADLTVYDADLAEGFIWIRKGKGNADRKVPISKSTVAWMRCYLDTSRPHLGRRQLSPNLFLGPFGGRIGSSDIARTLHACAKAAGIKAKVTPHVLRHTCATEMLRGGAPIRYVQEMLGHSRPSTTQVYTRVLPGMLEAMIEKCHPSRRTHFTVPRWRGDVKHKRRR